MSSGSRNEYVSRLAFEFNRYGVARSEVENFCTDNFLQDGFGQEEILRTIGSAYSHTEEFGTLCAVCANAQPSAKKYKNNNLLDINNKGFCVQNCATAQSAQNSDEDLQDAHFQLTFSDKIQTTDWCSYLGTVLGTMTDAESRDKMILGALLMNSGMMPNIYGIYARQTVYPPLYLLFYGASASRKGEIGCCRHIAGPLQEAIEQEWQTQMDAYRKEHSNWESMGGSASQRAKRGDEPLEPEYRSPIIPANSSASAAYQAIKANGGWGIMFETEASALTQSLLSDYGNYTTGLLAAFHHEPIKMNRVKDKLHIEIAKPRLTIGLTCTPGQLPKLFPTFEDGLGSRFLFYGLNRRLEWKSPFEKCGKPLDETYKELGRQSLELYRLMENSHRIQFLLKEEQEKAFDDFFHNLLLEQFSMLGEGISSFIFRLGLSTYRIAMVLSLLRRYSDRDGNKPLFADDEQALVCSDKDFRIAMTIMNTLVNHTAGIYARLVKENGESGNPDVVRMRGPERALYEALPTEFNSNELRTTASGMGINPDSARRYVNHFVHSYQTAVRVRNGLYRKVAPANPYV